MQPDLAQIPAWTDHYFLRTKQAVLRFGDVRVTYAVFMRRPVIAAPRLAVDWLRAVAALTRGEVELALLAALAYHQAAGFLAHLQRLQQIRHDFPYIFRRLANLDSTSFGWKHFSLKHLLQAYHRGKRYAGTGSLKLGFLGLILKACFWKSVGSPNQNLLQIPRVTTNRQTSPSAQMVPGTSPNTGTRERAAGLLGNATTTAVTTSPN